MEIEFIHPVNSKDILMFKRLCQPNSCFFSNGEAFINSYVFDIKKSAFCFNDNRTIFFLNRFNKDTYFFCCPKGINWQTKILDSILKMKEKMGKRLKRVWIWELSSPIKRNYLNKKEFVVKKKIVNKRYISDLARYKNLEDFFEDSKGVKELRQQRQQWNRFFNAVYRKTGDRNIFCKRLDKGNVKDAREILEKWRRYREKEDKSLLITREHIFEKNKKIIEDVLKKPALYESLILYHKKQPLGINIAFKVKNPKNISGCLFCFDREINGTGEVLYLLFFEYLAQKGYQRYNWGSSYLFSIENYKKKFYPSFYEYSYEYFLDFKK